MKINTLLSLKQKNCFIFYYETYTPITSFAMSDKPIINFTCDISHVTDKKQ